MLTTIAGVLSWAAAFFFSPLGTGFLFNVSFRGLSVQETVFLILVSFCFLLVGTVLIFFKRAIVNCLLCVFVTLATLLVTDRLLMFLPEANLCDWTSTVKDDKVIDCYPAIPEIKSPLHIKNPKTGQDMVCVVQDPGLRKKGYFPSRRRAVLLVGDSFTYGQGVGEEDTTGFVLGKAFPEFNFLNYGVKGHDIFGVKEMLGQALRELPDVKDVIYFYNINDVPMYGWLGWQQKEINDLELVRLYQMDRYVSPVGKFLVKSTIFRLINQALTLGKEAGLTVKNYQDAYDPQINPAGLKEVAKLLTDMAAMVRSRGGRFTVVLYPILHKTYTGQYPFLGIHKAVRDICEANRINFIDGYHAFRSDRSMRRYKVHPLIDYHPNGFANRRMVEYLLQVDKERPFLR